MMRGEIEPEQRNPSWLMDRSLQSALITSCLPPPLLHAGGDPVHSLRSSLSVEVLLQSAFT